MKDEFNESDDSFPDLETPTPLKRQIKKSEATQRLSHNARKKLQVTGNSEQLDMSLATGPPNLDEFLYSKDGLLDLEIKQRTDVRNFEKVPH